MLNIPQEAKIIRTNDMSLSTELHVIGAHLLHYESLLVDFEKSVLFIRDTPNPAATASIHPREEQKTAKELLDKECKNLLDEIERLQRSRNMQNKRLKNAMNLVSVTSFDVLITLVDATRCSGLQQREHR